MNKLIMTLAVAAAIALGCGTAGLTFADETPSNDASQGPKEGPKEGLKEGLKEGFKEGPKHGPRHGCRCRPEAGFDRDDDDNEGPKGRPEFRRGRGPKGRPHFDRDDDDNEGPKGRPRFRRGRGPRSGREGGRRNHREDFED